ncbi:MAG: tyrosine-type recombinase/integrase [Desulfosarcina sp.]|nr:tyrosine-type recombinase/integrase [Desulfobacterales bacterium]
MVKQSRKIHFTKRNIEKLKSQVKDAAAREIEWSDDLAIGLKCLCNKADPPRKTFLFRGVFRKRKIAIVLGTFPSLSVEEARKMVYEYRKMISLGIDPFAEKENNELNFAEFSEIYLKHAQTVNKSFAHINRMLRNHIIPVFGKYSLNAITKRDLQMFLDNILAKGRKGGTVNRYRSLLLRMFNLAVQWEYLAYSPIKSKNLSRQKESPGRDVFLTEPESRQFLAALDNLPNRISACALKLLTLTGKRHGETLSMKWSDVSLEEGIIYLRQEMTKANRAEKVFLSKLAKETLKELWELRVSGNPYVFPGNKPGRHLTTCRRAFKKAKEMAGITKKGVTIHTLRHSFASQLLANGASLFEVSRMLNHADMKTTQRYAHLSDNVFLERTEKLSNSLSQPDIRKD